jgi:hypothetical protein
MNQPVVSWDAHYADEQVNRHRLAVEGLDKAITKAKGDESISLAVTLAERRAYHEGERMKWELELRKVRGY